MLENESAPYSRELDVPIPVGTVIPGVLIMGNSEGERAAIRGAAKWKDGYWTLEISRDLKTGGKFDHDFVPGRSSTCGLMSSTTRKPVIRVISVRFVSSSRNRTSDHDGPMSKCPLLMLWTAPPPGT